MPRRTPHELRLRTPPRRSSLYGVERLTDYLHLSGGGRAALILHQRRQCWSYEAGRVLQILEQMSKRPWWSREFVGPGCGEPGCCPPTYPGELMDQLTSLAAHLPKRDARKLNRRLAAIGECW